MKYFINIKRGSIPIGQSSEKSISTRNMIVLIYFLPQPSSCTSRHEACLGDAVNVAAEF